MKRYDYTLEQGYYDKSPYATMYEDNLKGEWVKYEVVEALVNSIMFHLNQDKEGDYFLTKESYKELFDRT